MLADLIRAEHRIVEQQREPERPSVDEHGDPLLRCAPRLDRPVARLDFDVLVQVLQDALLRVVFERSAA